MILASLLLGLSLTSTDPSPALYSQLPDGGEGVVVIAGVPTDSLAPIDSLAITNSPAPIDSLAAVTPGDNNPAQPDTATVAEVFVPDPFDMITNLPSDWVDWTVEYVTLKNLPLIGAIGVVTAGMVITDYETLQPLKREYERSNSFRQASDAAVFIGDGKFQFGVAIAFAGYGLVAGDKRAVRTGSQVTEVILACGGVVQLLKHLTGRESPFTATTPTGRWDLLPNQIEYAKHVPHYDAFPSGHVATALATLTVITENYPEAEWIKWVGYPAIGALAVGMVASGIHWWSDYPLSIALGYTFGRLVASHGAATSSTAQPSSSQSGTGLRFGMRLQSDGSPAALISYVW